MVITGPAPPEFAEHEIIFHNTQGADERCSPTLRDMAHAQPGDGSTREDAVNFPGDTVSLRQVREATAELMVLTTPLCPPMRRKAAAVRRRGPRR